MGIVAKVAPKGSGLINVFVVHATCAVTTADLDPGMDNNTLEAIWQMIPQLDYKHHNPARVPSHLLGSIIGPSLCLTYEDSQLILGDWQRVVLTELDGPRDRTVIVICTAQSQAG